MSVGLEGLIGSIVSLAIRLPILEKKNGIIYAQNTEKLFTVVP